MSMSLSVQRRPFSLATLVAGLLAAIAAVVALAVLSAPAEASLEDGSWDGSGTGTSGGYTSIVSDGSLGPAQFTYNIPDDTMFSSSGSGEWVFETVAGSSGVREIDWDYAGFHAWFRVHVELEAFVLSAAEEGAENVYPLVMIGPIDCCTAPSGGFAYSGTTTLAVDAGDTYGFRMRGQNSDINATLRGTLTLEGFTADVLPEQGSATVGGTNTIDVSFASSGDDQPLDVVRAQLGAGLTYVPGSSRIYMGDEEPDEIPLADPDIFSSELFWEPVDQFVIDAQEGLVVRFGVAIDPDYADHYEGYAPAVVEAFGAVGGFEAGDSATFLVAEPPSGDVVLQQAIPLDSGNLTGIVGHLVTDPSTDGTLTFYYDTSCSAGQLGEGAVELGTFDVASEPDGELFFALAIENSQPIDSGFVTARFGVGDESPCLVAGPDNDSWTRALPIPVPGGSGSTDGVIDAGGVSRWFKFSIQPGATATVTLSDLPADYDLAVFKDISQAYVDLTDPIEDLNRLSAEFAPSVFSPSVFSPSVFSPSVFSPDAYAPSVFSPSVFSPSVFSPSVFSPSVFSPSVFSPSVFSPSVFSPSVFSPDAFASAQSRSIIGVSAREGTGEELVVANTWTNTGDYYIRVTGRNGAFDLENDFHLDVALDGVSCDLAGFTYPSNREPVSGTSVDTVIVWDSGRVEGSAAEISALGSSLETLAARPEVDGVVVDLSADAEVTALQSQAAANAGCIYATNLVAESIKGIVDSYRNPDLRFVTLVGGDDSVPFFRYPDQALLGPEQDYDPPVADDSTSQTSLRLNYILGQDEYGSRISVSRGDGTIPIPDLAVGRVVETAAEATNVVGAYLSTGNGVVSSASSLTTGYDFLTDAAEAVAGNLDAGTAVSGDRLIDPADRSPDDPLSWTADDLRTALLDSGRHDLVFLAGHFSANSALAADYETSIVTTELAMSSVDLYNSIVFSAGCHSGYNIVDGHVVPGVTLPLDWAQAFAQKGATLIGGTGYQYGDTDFVEYSERLYAEFSEQLRTGTGPVAIGEALMEAKQDYLEWTPDMRGLHRKSVIISTVFGLPMTSVDMPGDRLAGAGSSSIVPGTTTFAAGPGGDLGLAFADISVGGADLPFSLASNSITLKQLPDPLPDPVLPEDFIDLIATYYSGPNGVISNPAEPVVPLVSGNVSVPGVVLRGVGFRGGSYDDINGVVPLTGAPTTELRGVHTPFASEAFFPMRLATVNYFGELSEDGRGTTLNVVPTQYRVENIGDLEAVLRLYSDLGLRLYYSSNTASFGDAIPALAAPPTITGVIAEVVDADGDGDVDDIVFDVRVVGDPAAGIQETWVTYTDSSVGTWLSLDLVQDAVESTRWTGEMIDGAALSSLQFVVQTVNGVGLVTMDDNFGGYYEVVTAGAPVVAEPTDLALTAAGSGMFGSDLAVSATLTSSGNPVEGAAVLFSIGGSSRVGVTDATGTAAANLPLTSVPGGYTVTATYAGSDDHESSSADASFTISKAATAVTLAPGLDPVPPGEGTGTTATLLGPNDAPLNERTVYFTVTNGTETQTVPAITNFVGEATLGVLDLPAGSYDVTVRFLGSVPFPDGAVTLDDPTYEASSATGSVNLDIDTDGDGIADGQDPDDDNDGVVDVVEIEIGTNPLVVEVGRQFLSAVRNYAADLEGSSSDEFLLRWVVRSLDAALRDRNWIDDDSLQSRYGVYTIELTRAATLTLQAVVTRQAGLEDEAQTATDVIVFVDRQLAEIRIDEAIAGGGTARDIASAQAYFDKGESYAASGRWVAAIKEYRRAWQKADKAL